MKLLVLFGGLLLARPAAAQTTGAVSATAAARAQTEKDFIDFANEVGAYIHQVLTEPNDTVVVALLHGKEVQRLKQRKQQLEPALTRWRQSLSDAQMKEASARIDTMLNQSQFIKDMHWLETDAANVTRFKRHPGLKDLIVQTVFEIMGR